MTVSILDKLLAEYRRATAAHNWDGYTMDQMGQALCGELLEMGEAEGRRDIHGPHGMIAEALQVAVVAIRTAERLAVLHPVIEVPRG